MTTQSPILETPVVQRDASQVPQKNLRSPDNTLLSNSGTATFSGTGAQTAFTIAHGLSFTPTHYFAQAGSAVAAALFYATVDATNITVTFNAAPASGTNNVKLNWAASI